MWREVTGNTTLPGVTKLIAAQETGLLRIVPGGDPEAYPHLDAGNSSALSAAANERVGALVLACRLLPTIG